MRNVERGVVAPTTRILFNTAKYHLLFSLKGQGHAAILRGERDHSISSPHLIGIVVCGLPLREDFFFSLFLWLWQILEGSKWRNELIGQT